MRRFAQPCFNHEYIITGCPDCGWIAEVADEACDFPPASVGRSGNRRDNEDWLGPKDEHAVPHEDEAGAQTVSQTPKSVTKGA